MSATKTLEAVARDRVGKGAARAVRRQGQIPAVIYGGNQAPEAIAVDLIRTRTLIYAGGFKTTLFDITVGGKKTRAIPRDYQLDPVSGVPLHVDFLRVVSGQTVTVDVPVHFVNDEKAPASSRRAAPSTSRCTRCPSTWRPTRSPTRSRSTSPAARSVT